MPEKHKTDDEHKTLAEERKMDTVKCRIPRPGVLECMQCSVIPSESGENAYTEMAKQLH